MNNLVNGLRVYLASNMVLYLRTHSAHWNITGKNFFELHKLFEMQYNELWDQVDTIAEKIRELDEFVTVSPMDQIKLSVVEPEQGIMDSKGYVATLFKDHNRMITLLNIVFKLAAAENNQAIMNYIAERLDAHSKMRWFLKSSL